jgi:peptidoglycan/xylan/chitin deacetylase (PgdA/CDA1 family)
MIVHRIKRKLYKLTHPVVGEIWMLHRVVEQRSAKPEQRDLEVTPEWLEQKINDYRANGWNFVPIDNLPKSGRWVCITFDDGYRDNYTLAYPMLKRLNVPFTVYVATGFIDNRLPMWWYPAEQLGMSTKELRLLDTDPLCTIGAHTISHPKLDTLTREQQYHEIASSKQELEKWLGHDVYHFSFPHGAHNADTLSICRELGFHSIVQSWGGPLRRGERPCPLPRINMSQNE